MRVYQIRIDIFESQASFPIVTHLFHGKDAAHAERIHQAHRGADKFLQQCEDHGLYGTSVPCHTRRTEGWTTYGR